MPGFILGQWVSDKPLAGLHAEGGLGAGRGVRGPLQQVRGGGQGGGRDSGESRSLGPEAAWLTAEGGLAAKRWQHAV